MTTTPAMHTSRLTTAQDDALRDYFHGDGVVSVWVSPVTGVARVALEDGTRLVVSPSGNVKVRGRR